MKNTIIIRVLRAIITLPLIVLFIALKGIVSRLNKQFSLVGDHYFFPVTDFAWVAKVEGVTEQIQQELNELLLIKDKLPNFQDVVVGQYRLTRDNNWKSYFLYIYGHEVTENCKHCPRTREALSHIPSIKTAFFSILEGGKHIPPHKGPYNGVLRYHLGLKIPGNGEECRIRVGDELGYWREGKSLVFDDSYEHEAFNDADSERVVLFVDFVRPLPKSVSWLNKLVIYAFGELPPVQKGLKLISKANQKLYN